MTASIPPGPPPQGAFVQGSPAFSGPLPQEGPSLLQLLLILRRRWRLLAITWAAVVAAGAVYTFSQEKLFRPQATLEIRPETPLVSSEVVDAALRPSQLMWENYYRTQEAILTSPTLVQAVMKSLPDVDRDYKDLPDPVRAFNSKVEIEKVRTSFILKVGFVDKDPVKATAIANSLVRHYLDDANRRLRDLKSGAAELLSKETLPAIRAKVDEADQALQAFQSEMGFIDFEVHYKSLTSARQAFDARLTEIRLRRARIRAEVDALSTYGANGVTGLFNPGFHSTQGLAPLAGQRSKLAADLARERKVLKDKHPRILELEEELGAVERKIRESIEGTLHSLQTDLKAAELEEKTLLEDQGKVDRQIRDAGRNLNRYRRLESELASAKEVYSSYVKKQGETTATTGSTLGSVRILDDAMAPAVPYRPRVLVNLALSAVLGFLLGLGLIVVTEQIDGRIVSAREVEGFVGLEVLATIPKLSRAAKGGALVLDESSPLSELESFRTLRAQVLTRIGRTGGGKVVAVLSPLAGEGKSTVSVNLACVLAMEGRKVLIFDADMRRPVMSRLAHAADGPGFEPVLRGEIQIDQAISPTSIPGVHVLGTREGTSSSAELAGSPLFENALRYARDRYDFVIVDSAPVMLVSESTLVARRADAAILVVREGQTGRSAALSARRRLETMEVRVLGAVLNCSHHSDSGYGQYYS